MSNDLALKLIVGLAAFAVLVALLRTEWGAGVVAVALLGAIVYLFVRIARGK